MASLTWYLKRKEESKMAKSKPSKGPMPGKMPGKGGKKC